MHIVMLSDIETRGGAAAGASRLAEGFVKAGLQVTRIVMYSDGQVHPWTTQPLMRHSQELSVWKQLQRISRHTSIRLGIYTQSLWIHRLLRRALYKLRPDLINVHNLHVADFWPNLVRICDGNAPTVWTLHDMWSFTGRCTYNYDCPKFISGCDASCPTAREYPSLAPKLIAGAWRERRGLLIEHPELVAISPSRWLAAEALRGLWKGHRVEVIPNGLPLDIYKPLEKGLARRALGINTPGFALLVSAQDLQARRNGTALLTETLHRVVHRPLTLLTMGHGNIPINSKDIFVHPLGYIDQEQTKVLVYNAADLLVHPAPVGNLPYVVMEAIACGTPAVGFPIGGVVDLIRPGQTGWLARETTPVALAEALNRAITDLSTGAELCLTCRAMAEFEYGMETQIHRYLDLFHSLAA
jgi:glycosyltransferase involved in cell wall biosynthesis